ncbi:MAG: hemerythrin [Nitrospira sp.]|jgi:hemerythrin superfamily protein|nr:hemerythrin [Nitrospira sp.]
MDFVTLLRRDHEKVSSLFHQIQGGFGTPDTPERHQLFRRLKKELELHAAVEDLHVYRVFQQAEPTRDDAHEALEAHRKIKILLDDLEAAPAYDHTWIPRFQELHKLVEQHVAAEENEMFPKTVTVMTPQEAEELGVTVETAKQAISRDAPTTEGGTPEEI